MSGFRIAHASPDPTPKKRPAKRASYLKFLHELPCCITGRTGVQAAHVSFSAPWYGSYGRGRGTKVPDRFALPLCAEEHDLQHSCKLGSESDYWDAKGINPHELANTLWGLFCDYDEYEAIERCTARIRQGIK
jgi:hypothetical protein